MAKIMLAKNCSWEELFAFMQKRIDALNVSQREIRIGKVLNLIENILNGKA